MIKIQNLHFYYNHTHILNDVSFEAHHSELLGILGANGCGKSTLLKNILGFLKPKGGNIFIKDKLIHSFNTKQLANIISYIPQKSFLSMPLKVSDFLLAGRYSKLSNPLFGYTSNDFIIAKNIAKQLNVWQYQDRIITTLSGGEFGRILLARAIINEPQILLLDEPTSAMDLHYAIEILKIVKTLIKDSQICGIIVLHDLNLASLFCDKVLLMKNGKVLQCGTPKDLLNTTNLENIYEGLRCEIIRHNGHNIIVPL